jgi:Fe-S cluster assembly protein SufD
MATVTERDPKQCYLNDLERLAAQGDDPSWRADIREAGRAAFEERPWPHSKLEPWRFTDIRPITRNDFVTAVSATSVQPDASLLVQHRYEIEGWTELVFVDGFYAPDLSRMGKLPEGAEAGGLAEAIAADNATVQAHLDQYAAGVDSALTALNSAFLLDGAFVHLPKNAVCEAPIHLLFLNTRGNERRAIHPRSLIVLDESAEATVIETHAGAGSETFTNGVSEYVLGPNSSVKRFMAVLEDDSSYHLSTTSVHQQEDSRYKSHTISAGGQIIRAELSIDLAGEGASCDAHGLYMTAGKELVDHAIDITHTRPHCHSYIGYKGILDGESRAVYTGKVNVPPDSQQTDSNQLNQNLLLSRKALVTTKPQLEIYADDVKCTHGATIGQHPKELVYYFRTRGIDEATARGMLTYGFADDVVRELEVDAVRARMEDLVFNRYSPSAHRSK